MLMYILCGRHMVHKFHISWWLMLSVCCFAWSISLCICMCTHFFGVCICYIQIYSYRQTHVIMHARCAAIMYCKCLCVCVRACVSDAWTVTCAALQAVTYQTYQCLVSTCVYIKLNRVCRHIRTHSSHCG